LNSYHIILYLDVHGLMKLYTVTYHSRQIIAIFQLMDTFASTSSVNEISQKPGNKVLTIEHNLYLSYISKDQSVFITKNTGY
jgi:hypothetical protein